MAAVVQVQKKHKFPKLEQPMKCILVPIGVATIPYLRFFFETVQTEGYWVTEEDYERGSQYFYWQEAMFLCDLSENLAAQNKMIAMILIVLLNRSVTPTITQAHVAAIVDGLRSDATSEDVVTMQQALANIQGGSDVDQIEEYEKTIAELIGGEGVVSPVE